MQDLIEKCKLRSSFKEIQCESISSFAVGNSHVVSLELICIFDGGVMRYHRYDTDLVGTASLRKRLCQ